MASPNVIELTESNWNEHVTSRKTRAGAGFNRP